MAGVQGVWASKFNERAFLSMRKVGLDFRDLRMAVLVQRVVPAAYAFVIHTHNPVNNSPDEVRVPHVCKLVTVSSFAPLQSLQHNMLDLAPISQLSASCVSLTA